MIATPPPACIGGALCVSSAYLSVHDVGGMLRSVKSPTKEAVARRGVLIVEEGRDEIYDSETKGLRAYPIGQVVLYYSKACAKPSSCYYLWGYSAPSEPDRVVLNRFLIKATSLEAMIRAERNLWVKGPGPVYARVSDMKQTGVDPSFQPPAAPRQEKPREHGSWK